MQRQLAADRQRVVAFLSEQGFTAEEIEVRPLQVQDLLAREWGNSDVALRFTGQGQVLVKSSRVDAVAKAANASDPLIQAGIQLENPDASPDPATNCAASTKSNRSSSKKPPATPANRPPNSPPTPAPPWAI